MAGMDIEAESSGATQSMADLNMAAAPGIQVAAAPAPTAVVETPSAFAALIEHEMLAHFELIQAAHSINGHTIVPRSLDTKMEFDRANGVFELPVEVVPYQQSASSSSSGSAFAALSSLEQIEDLMKKILHASLDKVAVRLMEGLR